MTMLNTSLKRAFTASTAFSRPFQRACYHSYEHEPLPPYPEVETRILSNALKHVPVYGFTKEALHNGVKDAGYLDISSNLFRDGAFDIIKYHLVTQRLGLKERVQFSDDKTGVGARVRSLVLARLRGNVEAGTVKHWQNALGTMSLLGNISASIGELSKLSDEIWFLAGDVAVDTSWYTKRASLSGVYAAAELYQTQDQSTDFKDTEEFLDRRLEEVRVLGSSTANTLQWAGFEAGTFVNLLRSKGVKV